MPVQQTIEASQHTRGALTPSRRPAQTSEAVDTPTRTRAWNSVVAVLFLVVAMWGGYTAIGLPPVVIVGGSGLVAFVIWQRSYLRCPLDPSVILPALPADRRCTRRTHGSRFSIRSGRSWRNIWRGSVPP